MAEYIKTKGYEWNVYKNNYVKAVGRIDVPEPVEGTVSQLMSEPPTLQPLPAPTAQLTSGGVPEGLDEYLPFLRYLYEKRKAG